MINKKYVALFIFFVLCTFAYTANADHSWGSYHFARTTNPLVIKLGNNLTSAWSSFLMTTSTDWSLSTVLDTSIVPGKTTVKTCKPTLGRIEVCNSKYGKNGWLGIAQIWASGNHITQGITKLNDTYFNTVKYNTPAWKNLVMCQEIGHTFGLDHQDENFSNPNLGTCMDYTNDPSTNQHPNLHDYEELETIYAHLDATNTSSSTTASTKATADLNDPSSWGKKIKESSDKRSTLHELDLGKGNKVFTFVIWAE